MPPRSYKRPVRPARPTRKVYRKRVTTVTKKVVRRAIRKYAFPARFGKRLPGFPSNNTVKLRLTTQNLIQLGVGSNEVYPFKCNDVAVPITGSTYQPSLYSNWAKLYNHAMVTYARITCVFLIPAAVTGASTNAITFFLRADDDNAITGIGTADQYRIITEQGRTHYQTVMQGSQPRRVVLRGWYSPRTFFGVTDPMDNALRIGHATNPYGGPVDLAYWNVGAITADNTATGPNDISVTTTIDYFVKFSEPVDQRVISS